MANQAWQIPSAGKLVLNDLGPIPKPGPRQSLVRIEAVSLNYRDVLVLDHSPDYPLLAAPNCVPCSDGAGVVQAAGSNSKWKEGDRVYIHPNTWLLGSDARDFVMEETMGAGDCDGTLRRYIMCNDDKLVHVPEKLSMEEASTLYTAGVTAWRALFHGYRRLEPGMTVLTQGTGGVSCYAILIAAAHGATVISTSSSDEKLNVARQLGATHTVNYHKTPDWATAVLEMTNGKGVDLVVDVVGAGSIEETIRATRHGGLISLVGMLSTDPNVKVNIMTALLFGAKTIQAMLGAGSKQMSEELSAFVQQHDIHPPIAKVFGFEQAMEALEAIKKLRTPGKVVIKV